MRGVSLTAVVVAAMTVGSASSGGAEPQAVTLRFSVMRNGEPIGTSTVHLRQEGGRTLASAATHIAVKFASWTVYRFDQSESEEFADGRLQAMSSVTDDNGTVHRVAAQRRGDVLAVDADGKLTHVDPSLIPANPWNPLLIGKRIALNPQDGSVTPVAVTDHGEEQLMVEGRPLRAHHYSIAMSFPQDVWYDQRHQLVKVELHGSDGSRISYQPG
ncbi:MAG TPA: DUF6134 family protein [Stellaceae bacterium]|nr:DUF6134 family protein [Stellaceae bacterium]